MNKRRIRKRRDYVIFLPINFQTLRIILFKVMARFEDLSRSYDKFDVDVPSCIAITGHAAPEFIFVKSIGQSAGEVIGFAVLIISLAIFAEIT